MQRPKPVEHTIETLGFDQPDLEAIRDVLREGRPAVSLVVGPTGSGLSTTLAAVARTAIGMRGGDASLLAVEEVPPHLASAGGDDNLRVALTHVSLLEHHYTFAVVSGLYGREGAEAAFDMADTGVPTWSTMHGADVVGALSRLCDLGLVDRALVPGAVGCVVSQRILRGVCPNCAVGFDEAVADGEVPDGIAASLRRLLPGRLGDLRFIRTGHEDCERCRGSGRDGWSLIAAVLKPDETLLNHVRQGDRVAALDHWVGHLGGATMMAHAISRMLDGVVDPRHVDRNVANLDRVGIRDLAGLGNLTLADRAVPAVVRASAALDRAPHADVRNMLNEED